jgi:predicted secreted protein
MSWLTGVAVYVIIWWVVLFAVLPWGAAPPDKPQPGHATSAPAKPRMGLKALITTGIAAVIWAAVYALVQSDLISFRDLAR